MCKSFRKPVKASDYPPSAAQAEPAGGDLHGARHAADHARPGRHDARTLVAMKAVLTGHTRGLGAAIADVLRERGIPVLALSRGSVEAPDGGAPMRQVALDLADSAALERWLRGAALRTFLDGCDEALLINNAGMLGPVVPLGANVGADIARAVALNVAAPLMLADAFVAASAGATQRRIAHISSGAGRSPYAGWGVYCASKAALDHHARAAQLDAPAGTRIVSLAPGVIDTAMQAEIRATPAGHFPLKARFEDLKRDGLLTPPETCARRLVTFMLSERFGSDPIADLRDVADE
jgi:benzil reductase ((S)-benzoin forming)